MAMNAEVRFLHASSEIAKRLYREHLSDRGARERLIAADDVLGEAAALAEKAGVPAELEVVDEESTDRIVDRIVGAAAGIGATMIVVGSRGLGPVVGTVLGSVSQGVLKYAGVPVLVAHAEPELPNRS